MSSTAVAVNPNHFEISSDLSTSALTLPVEVQALKHQSSLLDNALALNSALTTAPISNTKELITQWTSAYQTLSALNQFTKTLNNAGRSHTERDLKVGAALMPLAALQIAERLESATGASDAEVRLLRVYANAHGEEIAVPEWFSAAHHYLTLAQKMNELPGPDVYLSSAKSLTSSIATQLEALVHARNETNRLRIKLGGGDDQVIAAQEKVNELERSLDSVLADLKDIYPEVIPECCKSITALACFSPHTMTALLELYHSVGTNIVAVATDHAPSPASLVIPHFSQHEQKPITYTRQLSAPFIGTLHEPDLLASLLILHADIRTLLYEEYGIWNATLGKRPEFGDVHARLCDSLESLLPGGASESALTSLLTNSNSDVRSAVTAVLATPVRATAGAGTARSGMVWEAPENIIMLSGAVAALLMGGGEAERIKCALAHTPLQPLLELTRSTAQYLASGDAAKIGAQFDEQLIAMQNNSGSYAKRAGLLLTMHAVANHPSVCRALKGNLKQLNLLPDVAGRLADEVAVSQNAGSRFVEELRREITRAFSFDLHDYWGQKHALAIWRGLVEKHLRLLSFPESWAGSSASEAFLNGYLFSGKPGIGKTFLVRCTAVHYGLPFLSIGQHEMAETSARMRERLNKSGEASNGKGKEDVESMFSAFLRERIAHLESAMKKSAAKAAILLLDEMEAEFLKRTELRQAPEQVAMIDSMLRIIEAEISTHPQILFVGCTNHLEMVDEAALRIGRFGTKIALLPTEREDVHEHVIKSLEKLSIDTRVLISDSGFENLLEAGVGMTPLQIRNAITNYCCDQKAKALEQRKRWHSDALTVQELQNSLMRMKELSHDLTRL